ncbi:MAG: cysteine desulfurase [Clostridia bacterium]|nr:cysteine desulfurase [Clostridia bacterium]
MYFDNCATTRPYDEVQDIVLQTMSCNYANPSALHSAGIASERLINEARKKIASTLHCNADELIFTSGGTESDNIAILGVTNSYSKKGKHIITSAIEHHAVLDCFKYLETIGFEVTYVGVDKNGIIDFEELKNSVRDDTILISIMLCNNETGVFQPVEKIRSVSKNAIIHTDAVQAYGKYDFSGLDVDLISVSGHKIHAPKGIGALVVKNKVKLSNVSFGGGQEAGIRSGTYNTEGILGFGKAAEITYNDLQKSISYLNNLCSYFKDLILSKIPDVKFNGQDSVNVVSVAFSGVRGEVLLHTLEEKGIYVSTGSACNSKSTKISYVLKAMGIEHSVAESSVRISFSTFNTKEEIDYAVEVIAESVAFLRKFTRR